MNRHEIISTIGAQYKTSNLENDEFSFPKALSLIGKDTPPQEKISTKGKTNKFVDIRFEAYGITILVETKDSFDRWNINDVYSQLQSYVEYEKVLTGNKIVAILANTEDNRLKVWWGSDLKIDAAHQLKNLTSLQSFEEYADLYNNSVNNREVVVRNTHALNNLLQKYSVSERLRSQFVGTILLSLKNGLKFEGLKTSQVVSGIIDILSELLREDKALRRASKVAVLQEKVLKDQCISSLKDVEMQEICRFIKQKISPHVNDSSSLGQDILNLFFTTFNKYVGKADKNQAFTPDHIVHFMCQVAEINRHSKILDPCCGSGSFLVRAMMDALDDCATKGEEQLVKEKHIYGVEYEEKAFGLATTNMLIHGDGNSNIWNGSLFSKGTRTFIEEAGIDVVLMNPPYNAQRSHCRKDYSEKDGSPDYVDTWKKSAKEDPSSGLYFVYETARMVKTGKLLVLLPTSCAISGEKEVLKYKEMLLAEHTLDAVFTMPSDMFHPGANVSTCCMVFDLGKRHFNAKKPTFFGYFRDDGFIKKKNLGRVQRTKPDSTEGMWPDIESDWLSLYRNRETSPGLSVNKTVSFNDEWLAEAYMETDYSVLTKQHFEDSVREFASFKIKMGFLKDVTSFSKHSSMSEDLNIDSWKKFKLRNIFDIKSPKTEAGITTADLIEGRDIPYIAAKKDCNGMKMMCSRKDNPGIVTKGGCVVFVQQGAGSAGYTTYQEHDFIGMGTIACGYAERLNTFNGLFLVTLLDLERPKYYFGRSWNGDRLLDTEVRLPAVRLANGKYEPDWDYMEKYIKSLPYSQFL